MFLFKIKRLLLRFYRSIIVGNRLQKNAFLMEHLYRNPKYDDPRLIKHHEFRVFSQGGEDGLLLEIFRRIGISSKTFVEIGLEDGLECNTRHLLLQGWTGLWIEGSARCANLIRTHFSREISTGQLQLSECMVKPSMMDEQLNSANIPQDLDLLSIDVDSIDYWLWEGLCTYRPRVLVMEYNGRVPPTIDWTYPIDGGKSAYPGGGASLQALNRLCMDKGYVLVGCGFNGCNAFWVREDLAGNHFHPDSSCVFHFEPLRDFLIDTHHVP